MKGCCFIGARVLGAGPGGIYNRGWGGGGQAAVLAVLVGCLLFITAGAALAAGAAGLVYLREHRDKTAVYAAAEAGVERVLARAVRDPAWLWGLKKGQSTELPGFELGGGRVAALSVVKEATEPPAPAGTDELVCVSLAVSSTGCYGKARKTLEVKARVYPPINFMGGVRCQSPLTVLGEGVRVAGNLFSAGALRFEGRCRVDGTVAAGGGVVLGEGAEVAAGRTKTAGNLILERGARLDAAAEVQGDVILGEGALVGAVEPGVDGGEQVIWRDIYYNGELLNQSGLEIDTSKLHPGQAAPLGVPPLFSRGAGHTARICDQKLEGSAVFKSEGPEDFLDLEGIIFVGGDLEISGRYRGRATVAAAGNIWVSGDLLAGGPGDGLLLISYGPAGIAVSAGSDVQALLCAPPPSQEGDPGGKVILGEGARLTGGVACGTLEMGPNSHFIYGGGMAENHPPWHTAAVNIITWKEQKGVY